MNREPNLALHLPQNRIPSGFLNPQLEHFIPPSMTVISVIISLNSCFNYQKGNGLMAHNLVVPADFYISPSEAARLLDLSVREIHLLQVKGKLKDVVTTPGNHRRYNLREVLSLQSKVQGDDENG